MLLKHGGGRHALRTAGEDRQTVFNFVARTGNADILRTFLRGLDRGQIQILVNMQTASGWSPLCTASAGGHLECVKLLLEVKIDLLKKGRKMQIIFSTASWKGGCVRLRRSGLAPPSSRSWLPRRLPDPFRGQGLREQQNQSGPDGPPPGVRPRPRSAG